MIDGKSVLGLITARGGSKGVPGKNIRAAGGKPLIAWTIEAGRDAANIDRLILSSDDDKIIEMARNWGCEVPFKRESRLAADDTPSIDVVFDALERCPGFGWVVLLQPTSPLRTAADIDAAIQHCVTLGAPACVSVCEVSESPYWMFTLPAGRVSPLMHNKPAITRRQDLPPVYISNGAIYVADTAWLARTRSFVTEETAGFIMPVERSVDVDTEDDFARLKF